jgi:hypothetical protein
VAFEEHRNACDPTALLKETLADVTLQQFTYYVRGGRVRTARPSCDAHLAAAVLID